jgi:hypothetical protein
MNRKRILRLAIGLAAAPAALPALAQEATGTAPVPAGSGSGLVELSDEEMGDMRGRYTVSGNTVAWFGVTMVSTWQDHAGQQLTSSMTVTMDLRQPDRPVVTFRPHVSITTTDAPASPPSGQREIDSAGLANVTGMVQSVQVAGDGNVARNTAHITVSEHEAPPAMATASDPGQAATVATAAAPGMNAVASVENNIARVLLQIEGHGAVEQWISRSGMGQSIQIASDGQQVSNRMELDLVRSTQQGRAALGQNVAQAIALSRGIAIGY